MRTRKTSQTRLERRNGQLSIFYKRRSDENEQEMMRISVGVEGSNQDSLRSSNSSPVLVSQSENSTSTSSTSAKKKKKKKRPAAVPRGNHTVRRMTSRPIQVRWQTRESRVGHVADAEIDEETRAILESLRVLNNKIRRKFEIGLVPTPATSLVTSSSQTSGDFSSTKSASESSVLTAKVYDYRGVPLSNPLAVTPFPRARSVKTREKAREMLKNFAAKEKEKEDAATRAAAEKAEKAPTETPKESPRKVTRVSSDTRFPGARSPATREKVRALLKEFAISQKNEPSESSDSSLKTIYSKNVIGCNSCNSCTECIGKCVQNHSKPVKKAARK